MATKAKAKAAKAMDAAEPAADPLERLIASGGG